MSTRMLTMGKPFPFGGFTRKQREKADFRLSVLNRVRNLKNYGYKITEALKIAGVSKATYYRWKNKHLRNHVTGLMDRSNERCAQRNIYTGDHNKGFYMLHVSRALDRIKEMEGITSDKDLCEILDVSKSTISKWKARNSFPYDVFHEYCQLNNISIEWLLNGRGPVYITTLVADPENSILYELKKENAKLRKAIKKIQTDIDEVGAGSHSGIGENDVPGALEES